MKLITILTMCFVLNACSSGSNSSPDCTKVKILEKDFQEISFASIPLPVKNAILELAKQNKMDTAFSLENRFLIPLLILVMAKAILTRY